MQDEQTALNQINGEETIVDTTPVVEEQTAEETPVETTEQASEGESNEVETDQIEKKGAQSRIRELAGEVKSLKQKLAEATVPSEYSPAQQFPQPQIDLNEEVTPEQYRQHVMQQADTIVQLRLKQSEAINRISQESVQVEKKYPQLDPDSDQFDKELSETISDAIEAQVKLNPYSTSVKSVADKLMRPYLKAISNGVAQEKETIAKQVSESALRPTTVRKAEKTATEMSIAELEAKLGIIQA